METTRQKKFSRTLLKELSGLLQFEVPEFQDLLITVRYVRVTPDLQLARVYLTCFPENQIVRVLETLEKEHSRIRYLLGIRLRQVVRVIPELEFYEDETDREANRIHSLLDSLNLPPYIEPVDSSVDSTENP
jgi:ribosome-binding factor A